MSFCARVCELSPGDICTTSRTNPIGLDVCANGLYCATKKDTSNFGRCERIVQVINFSRIKKTNSILGMELRRLFRATRNLTTLEIQITNPP